MVLNIGDLWVLLAVGLWAAQTIIVRWVPKDLDLIAVPGRAHSLPA